MLIRSELGPEEVLSPFEVLGGQPISRAPVSYCSP